MINKSTAAEERGDLSPASKEEALAALERELRARGVVQASERVAPSKKGSRLPSGPKERRRWVDGPFTESKELIAGFSILELPSKAEALAWAERYANILDGNEVDVLELR